MAQYNFMRGRQMVIHDPRLNNPLTTPPSALRPPAAYNVWTVSQADTAEGILGWAATVAGGSTGKGLLDALHFMAHGNIGYVQIGSNGFSWNNVAAFKTLAGKIRHSIVFFSCLVGGDQAHNSSNYNLTFGNAVAAYAQCKVVVCQATQFYSWSGQTINFGAFEGVVNVYTKGGAGRKVYNYSSKSTVNLENVVFG